MEVTYNTEVNSAFNYRPGSILPAEQTYPPVSTGELTAHKYQVSTETLTEDIALHFETHHEVPGVILINGGKFHSVIPRSRFFERLGHRFGAELFLRKPIIELQENLETKACIISSNTRINTAINIGLSRPADNIYDPLVMEYDDGSNRMLDMHVLLMAQSLVMENTNNIISNMNRIEQSIKADIPLDASLDMIIDAVKRTTPYHRAIVLIKPNQGAKISSHHDLFHHLSEPISSHPIIKSIYDSGNHIHIEDTSAAPLWKGMEFIGKTNVWVGLPIASGRNFDGILSLSRTTNTPFSKNEIDMATTFSEFLSIAINRTTENHADNQFIDMIKRKFIY